VARAYGVISGDRSTASRWTFYIGKDGKILAIDKDVKVDTAGADIAAKLAELGVARRK
jgi:peroxiredoxin Q/BCP